MPRRNDSKEKRRPSRSTKREPKAESLRRHASRRAIQRYGMSISKEEHDQLVKQVQAGQTDCIEQQSHRISVHEAQMNGQTIRFAYDKKRGVIVTYLHRDPKLYQQEIEEWRYR